MICNVIIVLSHGEVSFPLYLQVILYYAVTLQRTRFIVGDAGFESRMSVSEVGCDIRISHHDSKCRLFVRVCMKCFVLLMAGTESPPLERSETQGAALEKELYRYSLSALGSVRKFNSWRLWLSSILYVTKFSTIFLMYRYLFLRTLLNNHTDSLFTVHQ